MSTRWTGPGSCVAMWQAEAVADRMGWVMDDPDGDPIPSVWRIGPWWFAGRDGEHARQRAGAWASLRVIRRGSGGTQRHEPRDQGHGEAR